MSLVMQPNPDGAPSECNVVHGGLLVGRIYRRKVALRSDAQWLWALNGLPEGPLGLVFTGQAATCDEALTALAERWGKWLAWAGLTEAG
jgi:hypothetical protein